MDKHGNLSQQALKDRILSQKNDKIPTLFTECFGQVPTFKEYNVT